MTRVLVTLLYLAIGGPALAQTTDELRAEVEDRVARNNWQAADRAYEALADQAKPTAREHWLGGRAAQALGEVNEARVRYEAAVKADRDEASYAEALAALLAGYGEVKLKVAGSHSGGVPLRPDSAVIDAEPRRVIEEARRMLSEDGRYTGLLPLGGYKLGEASFTVTAEKAAKATLK